MSLTSSLIPYREAAAGFRSGRLSPREYLEQALANVAAAEATVNAFAHLDLESARRLADAATERYRRGAALSDIDGMPVGIKDIIDTADMPTQMGSDVYRGWQPRSDAACVQAIRRGGGIPVGKTRTTEFAIGRSASTRNPHDPDRTPGGSSSGSAAGVASGMFCAGLGTQTRGSVIRPASYCGVVGYKPTWGALPLSGIHPVATSHDHLGVIAESLDSAWRLAWWIARNSTTPLSAGLAGTAENLLRPVPVHRLAVLRTAGYAELDEAASAAFERRLESWRSIGIDVVEPRQDGALAAFCDEMDRIDSVSAEMIAVEMQWPYRSYAERHGKLLGQKIHDLVRIGADVDRLSYARHLDLRRTLRASAAALGEYYDALVLPSASGVAPAGLANTGSRTLQAYGSFLGLPACSLPLIRVAALPFGVQLLGAANADYRLLCHAQWLMQGHDSSA